MSDEGLLSGLEKAVSPVSFPGSKRGISSLGLFFKVTNSIHEGSSLMTSKKLGPSRPSLKRVSTPTYKCGDGSTFSSLYKYLYEDMNTNVHSNYMCNGHK